MAERHLCLFDLDDPLRTFADRHPYPLYQYIQSPPKEGDRVWVQEYDFLEFPLSEIVGVFNPAIGDVLEVELLDRRVQFQGLRISVVTPALGVSLEPFTNSGATFDFVDCNEISEYVYLPFGGKMNKSTDLRETSFVLDDPDYIGLRVLSESYINTLNIRIAVMYSNTFSGLGTSNRKLPTVI